MNNNKCTNTIYIHKMLIINTVGVDVNSVYSKFTTFL